MYTRTKTYLQSSNIDPIKFIETTDSNITDINNSTLLYMLDEESNRSFWTITKNEKRIDLIAKDIYGDEKYSWILLYINRINVGELTRGTVLEYIPLATLLYIINSI